MPYGVLCHPSPRTRGRERLQNTQNERGDAFACFLHRWQYTVIKLNISFNLSWRQAQSMHRTEGDCATVTDQCGQPPKVRKVALAPFVVVISCSRTNDMWVAIDACMHAREYGIRGALSGSKISRPTKKAIVHPKNGVATW